MISITLSDAEAYAVSIAISKYIAEHVKDNDINRTTEHLANISNKLFEHGLEMLSSWDRTDIEKDISYKPTRH